MIGQFGTFEFPLANRYRFDAKLGSGATGVVYRAFDLRLQRDVAIKVLHRVVTQELGIARFRSEVRLAASLRHPSIAVVHDYDESDDRLYYVMEFLAGETLRDRLMREETLVPSLAMSIAAQISDALQYAHDRGVVHRDVKPENIMLVGERAWLVDFGLALAIGTLDVDRLTATGLAVGTPAYLSPEQATGDRNITPRADQYGLACVVFEMLVGVPPFVGPTAAALVMRHATEIPPRLRSRLRSAPDEVDAAIARALDKIPDARFPRIEDFARALPSASSLPHGDFPSRAPLDIMRSGRGFWLAIGAIIAVIGLYLFSAATP